MRVLSKETLFTIQITSSQVQLLVDALKSLLALENGLTEEEEVALSRLEELLQIEE